MDLTFVLAVLALKFDAAAAFWGCRFDPWLLLSVCQSFYGQDTESQAADSVWIMYDRWAAAYLWYRNKGMTPVVFTDTEVFLRMRKILFFRHLLFFFVHILTELLIGNSLSPAWLECTLKGFIVIFNMLFHFVFFSFFCSFTVNLETTGQFSAGFDCIKAHRSTRLFVPLRVN